MFAKTETAQTSQKKAINRQELRVQFWSSFLGTILGTLIFWKAHPEK